MVDDIEDKIGGQGLGGMIGGANSKVGEQNADRRERWR